MKMLFFFFKELLSRVWGENRETPSPLRHSLFRPDLVKPGTKFLKSRFPFHSMPDSMSRLRSVSQLPRHRFLGSEQV